MNDKKYVVSSIPHIRSADSIERIMLDVVIALTPACFASVYFFGLRALLVLCLSILSCVVFEWFFQKITKQPIAIGDFSAVVTGMLLAMNLPSSVPFWIPIVGSLFAIIIVKQLFGGLGQNFMNPALAGRAFLQIAYPTEMIRWTPPGNNIFSAATSTTTSATPLGILKTESIVPNSSDLINAFVGNIPGSLGETCAIALLIGGVYLLIRKVISWRIPVIYIATFGVLCFVLGRNGLFSGYPLYEILLGGLLLGAFFMATDYSSAPVSPNGQIIMGLGCGVLTYIIRMFGGYPEGVCYAILLMNLTTPLIDRYVRPQVFGVKKEGK